MSIAAIDLRFRIRESFADENEIEVWKADLGPAENLQVAAEGGAGRFLRADVQAMVQKCLADHAGDRGLRERVLAALKDNKVENLQFTGKALAQIFAIRLKIHALVRDCAERIKRLGPVDDLAALADATRDYTAWGDSLVRSWPWVNYEQLARSYASFQRAEHVSTLDFLDELRNSADAGSVQ